MATNKNAQIRYLALDSCLSNRYKKFFIGDLIEYCCKILSEHYSQEISISRRQILEDIRFMESAAGYAAPVERIKDGKCTYYRYENKDFSIRNNAITTDDEEQLRAAIQILTRIQSIPGFNWAATTNTKISSGLGLQHNREKIMSFQENEFLRGIEHLNPLYNYAIQHQTIQVTYQSFKASSATEMVLSPYHLKQYNNRWFLFGWNHKEKFLQNLPLDRILKIKASNVVYIPGTIDFETWFDDIVGVTNDSNARVFDVKIELSENIIPYLISKPIHGSQKIKNNMLSLSLKHNYELESLILSYGENMKVLEPDELRSALLKRVKALSKLYPGK